MQSDLAQIKILLWVIIGLMVFFVVGNILCRVFNCGKPRRTNYGDLWEKGKLENLLAKAQARLHDYPNDVDALYFTAKVLNFKGLYSSARTYIERMMLIDPTLYKIGGDWLKEVDAVAESKAADPSTLGSDPGCITPENASKVEIQTTKL